MIISSEYVKDITDPERKKAFKIRLNHVKLDTEQPHQEQFNYLWKECKKLNVMDLEQGMMMDEASIVGMQIKVVKEIKRLIKYTLTKDEDYDDEESKKIFIEEYTDLLIKLKKKKSSDIIHIFFNKMSGSFILISDNDALTYLKEALIERGAIL